MIRETTLKTPSNDRVERAQARRDRSNNASLCRSSILTASSSSVRSKPTQRKTAEEMTLDPPLDEDAFTSEGAPPAVRHTDEEERR
jgi:hypothetical protein